MGHPVTGCGKLTLLRLPSSAKTCVLTPALLQATTSSSKVLPACAQTRCADNGLACAVYFNGRRVNAKPRPRLGRDKHANWCLTVSCQHGSSKPTTCTHPLAVVSARCR